MSKKNVLKAKENGFCDWQLPIKNKYRLFCCDCGLAHDFEFKIHTDGNIIFRLKRNDRSTGQARRHNPDLPCKPV